MEKIMRQINLPGDVTAIYEEFPNGSEVNIFKHNHFIGRRWFPLTGMALKQKLELIYEGENRSAVSAR